MTRQKNSLAKTCTAALSTLLLAGAAHAVSPPTEYVQNGSFESGSANGEFCYLIDGCTVSNWTGTGGAVNIDSSSNAWGRPDLLTGWSASQGGQVLGLQNTSTLSQSLTLNGAGLYLLSWLDAGRASYGGTQGTEHYTVSFADNVLASFDVGLGQAWQSHSLSFTASGPGTLMFRANAVVNGTDNTAFIDKVSVTSAVPEPESYAMLLAGLGAMGFVARRRLPKGL